MNVAGPSSRRSVGQFARDEGVESAYEADMVGLLDHLSLDEIMELHTAFAHRMKNAAMINLLQQIRDLVDTDEDARAPDEAYTGEHTEAETEGDFEGENIETEIEQVDGENAESEIGASDHQQGGVRIVRDYIARFLPRKGWVTMLARRARVAMPSVLVVRRRTNRTDHVCVVCHDLIPGTPKIRAPCGHYYDIGCATDLFRSAMRDETSFPPQCCSKNIPLSRFRRHLPRTLTTAFREKQVEFSTLKRVYCSSPTCSRFLGPVSEGGAFGGRVYACPASGCRRRTCGKCREPHSGDRTHVCCPDAGASQVLELGRASGWARCPGCSHMIEHNLGCFHTTCRCGTGFCYLCRAVWKTCECPQWDEELLLVDEESDVE